MDRHRGFWWAPDGESVAACRVDVSPVATWWIADPARPDHAPASVRFPAAGTANAVVTLHVLPLAGGNTEISWDRNAFPYLARVMWEPTGLTLLVQSRDQRRIQILVADVTSGSTRCVFEDRDDAWVAIIDGSPAWLGDGRLVTCADRDGSRRLVVDGTAVSPDHLQVRSILDTGHRHVLFTATDIDEPEQQHVFRWTDDGVEPLTSETGIHTAVGGGQTIVLRSATPAKAGAVTSVDGGATIASFAETPLVEPDVSFARIGPRRLTTAVLMPRSAGAGPWPVLLDPYGGPSVQRAVAAYNAHLTSQWFADQGFAVVVVDGRGTPGRGSAWERAILRDLAGPVLDDQVDALHGLAATDDRLDLGRVAIRGWSFGGYLAALAVLRRPDVFHAAIAGAPVTDWRLYDTHYTERYLGDPTVDAEPYDATSLLADAARLVRPLLLIHGLADDNVVAAHTLQLSSALLAAGRSHRVLPLSGVTHMTPQEVVAENLLLFQLAFLREALGLAGQ
jgi:dipeptidyl-peptidase-4